MKTLCLRYYSGTGNTKRAVDRIVELARAKGIAVDASSIASGGSSLDAGDSMSELFLAFSVLGFGAAHSLRKRIATLPAGKGRKARLLAVCGAELRGERRVLGWPGQALEQVEGILRRKGYEVASSAFVSYPVNWMQVSAPVAGETARRLLEAGDDEVRAYAEAALDDTAGLYRCGTGNRLWNVPAAFLFDAIGRRFLGKLYAVDSKCKVCGLCARSCPAHAIAMTKRGPRWKSDCDACNRCINLCPERAIQTSAFKIALDLVLSAGLIWASFPLTRLGLGALGLAYLGAWEVLIALALATALTPLALALIFGPIDALLRFAARMPGFRRFLALGPSRSYGRYLAPGFVPGKDRR
jgi:ferredoxin